ncbi:MAG: 3'-5' exoribonuclease [Chitinophagales bacterium]|nr:3'-5' exoribonuclease [Chitinophagales bacterium]
MSKTKIFFDTEFTGLQKATTLISIGAISECGKTFYAELTDFNLLQVDAWIEENILSKLHLDVKMHGQNATSCFGNDWLYKGTKQETSLMLEAWLKQFDEVEMWGDCLAYDWVLFNDLFRNAFKMPENVYYIPFDICTLFKLKDIDPDINREAYGCRENYYAMPKHNSLWDARVIKMCYERLMNVLP